MNDFLIRPVREIPIGTISLTGSMPGGISFESTLERDLLYLFRFDITVTKIIHQPVQISYQDEFGVSHEYTPDFLIFQQSGVNNHDSLMITLIEVKYADDVCSNFRVYHPKFRAAQKFALNKGWVFKVLTERNIRSTYLNNAKFLLAYLDIQPDLGLINMVQDKLYDLRETSIEALLISLFKDKWNQAYILPVIWNLIANRKISTNLLQPLTMTSRIWIERDN